MGQWIPPGLSNAHNAAFIPSECSQNAFPEEGIKVFGSMLHQHTIGVALHMWHIRNGKELPPIDINLDYEFSIGHFFPWHWPPIFDEPIVLLPGDEFILDCYIDSSERDGVTTGGESSSQEMCFAFLWYYPALGLKAASVAKSPSVIRTFWEDAQQAGYMNGTTDDIDTVFQTGDVSLLHYDGSMDGALEFYNRLYSVENEEYNQHTLICEGKDGRYNDEFLNVARDESFEKYDLGVDQCDNSINADDGDVGICKPASSIDSPDGSEMNSFISGCIVISLLSLLLTLWIFIFFCSIFVSILI